MPDCIGQLRGLEVFKLSSNRLSGALPDSFGGLDNLAILALDHNRALLCLLSLARVCLKEDRVLCLAELTGQLPNSLGDMKNLGILRLSGASQLFGFPR